VLGTRGHVALLLVGAVLGFLLSTATPRVPVHLIDSPLAVEPAPAAGAPGSVVYPLRVPE
jgi:hypothetical protein